jgi:hypothetical protein
MSLDDDGFCLLSAPNDIPIDELPSLDQRTLATEIGRQRLDWKYSCYAVRSAPEVHHLLFIPSMELALIAWGAQAEYAAFTDATSPADAIQRYCHLDGKQPTLTQSKIAKLKKFRL